MVGTCCGLEKQLSRLAHTQEKPGAAPGLRNQFEQGEPSPSRRKLPSYVEAIVTNPPFKNALDFAAHGLELCPRVILLLQLTFVAGGGGRTERSKLRGRILDSGSLARVHVFRNRLPMMHRDGQGIIEVEKTTTNALDFAWYVWDRNHKGPTELHRLTWTPLS